MANFSHHRALVRHWNAGVAKIPGWPNFTLLDPPYVKRFTGPAWEDFPQGLRDDIDAYCARIGKRHKTVSGRIFRPCKQSTIDTRRALARSEALSEIEIERLEEFRIALEQYHSTGLTEK